MKVNYKSDFDFIATITDCTGKDVGVPQCDWTIQLYTNPGLNMYVASHKDGVFANCLVDDEGRLHIVCDNHGLQAGSLRCRITMEVPNSDYPDGYKRVVNVVDTGIELIEGRFECECSVEANLILPYIKGDKGDPFTFEDFTPEQLAYLRSPAVNAASRAHAAANAADGAADDAQAATAAAERLSETVIRDEEKRVDAEALRVLAEQSRAEAEMLRASAETARATEYTQIKAGAETATSRVNQALSGLEQSFSGKQDTLQDSEDIIVSDNKLSLTERAKRYVFNAMWDVAWKVGNNVYGKYDPDNAPDPEHPYLGNGLWMTYEEAIEVMINGVPLTIARAYYQKRARTNLPYRTGWSGNIPTDYIFAYSTVEVVRMGSGSWWVNGTSSDTMFMYNGNLVRIINPIILHAGLSYTLNQTFAGCSKLEDFQLKGLHNNINLASCPKLNYATFYYMITNRANANTITITVANDVFAKLTGDTSNAAAAALTEAEAEQWQELVTLALSKNISFAM